MKQINRYKLLIYAWAIIGVTLVLGGLTPAINGIILIFSLIASMFADNAIYVSENAKEMQFRKKICHKIYGI